MANNSGLGTPDHFMSDSSTASTRRPTAKARGQELLHAVCSEDYDRALELIDAQTAGHKGGRGCTVLMLAAQNGWIAGLRALLPLCDAKATCQAGLTALMRAARFGYADCVHELLPHSDPLARSTSGLTALMLAARPDGLDCVNALLSVSDPHAVDSNGDSALLHALLRDASDCAAALAPRSDVNAKRSIDQATPLILAASLNDRAALDALLRAGADPLAADKFGQTALHCAGAACIEALLPGSDAGARDSDGQTPLMHAAARNAECVSLLLPASDPRAEDDSEQTALHIAASRGEPESVELLAPLSDLDARDGDRLTALMVAARGGDARAIKALLPGSDLAAADRDGETALHLAARSADDPHEGVRLLLSAGANAKAVDTNEMTPLMRAALNGNAGCVRALLPHSNAFAICADGRTALDMAVACDYQECADALPMASSPKAAEKMWRRRGREGLPQWAREKEAKALNKAAEQGAKLAQRAADAEARARAAANRASAKASPGAAVQLPLREPASAAPAARPVGVRRL